ncbi:MAG: FRG domain-containing protein [Acidobacteriia bacterium]|nr:FRG domain-containing protein [Terriglobia bacterium]
MINAPCAPSLETNIPTKEVRSVGHFVDEVELIAEEWRRDARDRLDPSEEPYPGESVPWLRGVSDKDYPLEPTLLRSNDPVLNKYNQDRDTLLWLEGYMLSRFRSGGQRLVEVLPKTHLGWIFLMQHHGLPTRLLDWSKNALTALYFAVRTAKETEAAVFVLDPRTLSEKCGLGRSIADPMNRTTKDRYIDEYLNLSYSQGPRDYYPIPLIPPQISDRLAAQHSRFTLHTNRRGALADFMRKTRTPSCCHMKRLTIPVRTRTTILRTLRLTGATQPDILPGLDNLATDIRERIELGLADMRGPAPEHSGSHPVVLTP